MVQQVNSAMEYGSMPFFDVFASSPDAQPDFSSPCPSPVEATVLVTPPQKQKRTVEVDMSVVTEIGPNDILCGRSKLAFHNAGNQQFRAAISLFLPEYLSLSGKKEKTQLIIRVVEHLRSVVGARFLKPVKKSKGGNDVQNKRRKKNDGGSSDVSACEQQFEELGDRGAREKVGHALRDLAFTTNKVTMRDWKNSNQGSDQVVSAPTKKRRQPQQPQAPVTSDLPVVVTTATTKRKRAQDVVVDEADPFLNMTMDDFNFDLDEIDLDLDFSDFVDSMEPSAAPVVSDYESSESSMDDLFFNLKPLGDLKRETSNISQIAYFGMRRAQRRMSFKAMRAQRRLSISAPSA